MPSSQEFFDRLGHVLDALGHPTHKLDTSNDRLQKLDQNTDQVESLLQDVRTAVQQVNGTLQTGFSQLITIGNYTNQALEHNAKQNDTIICILEHISKNTCDLVTESHKQTALQTAMKESQRKLADLFAATHAAAALQWEKDEALRKQIEECCPPPRPEPACRYEKCPAPDRLGPPPKVEPQRPPRPVG
jgi:ABC-type transporter Mla subunit MlaD